MAVKLTLEEFVRKANITHKNKYDYSKAVYVNASTKLKVICPIHGVFETIPKNHIRKNGCPKCGGSQKLTKKEFIEKAKTIHGNKYKYNRVNYVNYSTKVDIECPIHGIFSQSPSRHISGDGCPKCGKISYSKTKISKHKELFVSKAKAIHGDKYDYSLVNYTHNKSKVQILCPTHGVFEQSPSVHLHDKCGCPKCGNNTSKLEEIISEYLQTKYPDIKVLRRDRSILSRCGVDNSSLELDFYLPEYKLAIEVHGNYWHSEAHMEHHKARTHIHNKYKLCKEKGIQLLQFYEDEITYKLPIVRSIISYKLGKVRKRTYARKLKVVKLNKDTAKKFLDIYHLQGKVRAKEFYGLVDNSKVLYTVMAFSHTVSHRGSLPDPSKWELVRYASMGSVVGGASKLLKHFISTHSECTEIVSYSDNRISDGSLYETLGFEIERIVPSDYYYITPNTLERLHKSTLRKKSQAKLFTNENNYVPYDDSLTEYENAYRNNFYRLWNAGLIKWSLTT